ncbi:hypothetical protein PMZ80_001673 [Knufia obscura]|uniref:Uncharacterized protein n=1 Tax=Knufia obscura TaxID=1635080 RepID=A0ABR0S3U3_9EURO|nr:hypothetical protein PMZ80_001673 [Knufia obscura]
MSSDGSSLPSVTPDFVYIVKIGDFQHVLRPAEHKSCEYLGLARQAVAHIDMARNLLTERGPFLLSERQQKMDELICDTEEAIDRVLKLLEPARVEQVSEESVRINTKNPWTLEDGPKSAATFGRLQTTHDKLKTVLHDLKNIEATAQLDNCEVRANTVLSRPLSSQSQQTQPSSSAQVPMAQQQNPKNLLAWKRSRHRQSRQTLGNDNSSVSGVATDDHPNLDLQSPVSSHGNTLMGIVDGSVRHHRDQTSSVSSLPYRVEAQDDSSAISMDKLPVIHELDGASAIAIKIEDGRSKAIVDSPDESISVDHQQQRTHSSGKLKSNDDAQGTMKSSTAETTSNVLPSSPGQEPSEEIPTPQPVKDRPRDTYADYRERAKRQRGSRQEPQAEPPVALSSSPTGLSTSPQQENIEGGPDPAPPQAFNVTAQTSHKAKKQHHSTMAHAVQTTTVAQDNDFPHSRRGSSQLNESDVSECKPKRTTKQASSISNPRALPPISSTTLRHIPADADHSQNIGLNSPQNVPTVMPTQSGSMLSPSRTQNSPQAQTPSSATQETELFLHAQPPAKSHEIFRIDPKLARLPSLLRAGQKGRSKVLPPYPVSETGSDHDNEDQISELPRLRQVQSAMERPITAPPIPHPTTRATHPPLQIMQAMEEYTHQRSFSDSVVPQINVTRAPTIPRKPVPYRNSMLVSGTVPGLRALDGNTQSAGRPQSGFFPSAAVSEHGVSSPPSPLQSDNRHNLTLPTHSSTSLHSLSVQGPSSLGSSRRSSVSAEEQPNPQPPQGAVSPLRPRVPNPLTMHPTSVLTPQPSAYQAQSAATHNRQQVWVPSQPDYRSPAFQQSRHFVDPSHNEHLGPSERPPPPPSSRFRDRDQAVAVPHTPNRSRTEPVERHVLEQARMQPRRASEQDQMPLLRNQVHNRESAHSQSAASPQMGSLYQGRAQLVYVKPTPYQAQNAGLQPPGPQPPVDRSSITRTAPPADTEHNAKRLPIPDIGRGASLNHNVGRQNMKDKDLFGRQVWRAEPHDQQQQQQRYSYYEPQQQTQQQPRTPLQLQPQAKSQHSHSHDKPHQHACHCDDNAQSQPAFPNGKTSSPGEVVPHVRLTPVHEGQAMSSAKPSAEIPLYPPQPQTQLELEPAEQKQPTKKRSGWLAHQANRHRLIGGRR